MKSEARASLSWRSCLFAGAVAFGISLTSALWLGPRGLNLADEGFLFYGVQRVRDAQVPLRDFQSYEPARYYWCAAWGTLFGDGFLGLRRAIAVFQFLGLWAGLLALARCLRPRWVLVPLGIALALWMFPRHKVFESSLAMMAVFAAQSLVLWPGRRVELLAGVFTGLAACFGRNHGLYCALGLGLLIVFLAFKRREGPWFGGLARSLGTFVGGIFVGFSPLLLMCLFVPGFFQGFLDSILFFLREGSNLPKPYPWPWSLGYGHLGPIERFSVGASFLLPVLIYPVGLVVAVFTTRADLARRSLFFAATFLGLFYCHQASVRSDAMHLAQSIHPALLALAALPLVFRYRARGAVAAGTWGLLFGISIVACVATHPLLTRHRAGARSQALVQTDVLGDELQLERGLANYVDAVQRTLAQHVPADERQVFMAPTYSSFYPLLGKVSPVWRIYFLWEGSAESQDAIIAELEAREVRWAFVIETAVDGRAELMFRNSHARVWRYLQETFERVPTALPAQNHFLLRRRP